MMTRIQESRQRAGLTCAEVAHAIGRTPTWVSQAEAGMVKVPPEQEAVILTAIDRLTRFAATVAEAREKLIAGLRLPALIHTGSTYGQPKMTRPRPL